MTSFEQSYAARLYPRLAVLAVGLFIVGSNGFVIAGLLPSIAKNLGVQASDVSYSITFYALTVAIAAPVVSIVFARVSRTALMSIGLVLVALGTLVAASASTLPLFTIGRIVAALGGAALVPAATAAAAILAPVERRGRAIAFVSVGFTAAIAFGSPLGTLLAAVGGWRLPLFVLASLAAVTATALALTVRRIPLGEAVSVRRRFGTLKDPRILLVLLATLLAVSGFNVVYIFSSEVTSAVTHESSSVLAALLFVFGVGGILGNIVIGPLTDRVGNRRTATVILVGIAISLLVLPLVAHSFIGTVIVFAVWGVVSNSVALPLQHRLVQVNPATAGVALSWYSSALYGGIAIAPPLGAVALGLGDPELIPVFGAIAVVLALAAFQVGSAIRGARLVAVTP